MSPATRNCNVHYCDLQGCEGEYIGDTTGVN